MGTGGGRRDDSVEVKVENEERHRNRSGMSEKSTARSRRHDSSGDSDGDRRRESYKWTREKRKSHSEEKRGSPKTSPVRVRRHRIDSPRPSARESLSPIKVDRRKVSPVERSSDRGDMQVSSSEKTRRRFQESAPVPEKVRKRHDSSDRSASPLRSRFADKRDHTGEVRRESKNESPSPPRGRGRSPRGRGRSPRGRSSSSS